MGPRHGFHIKRKIADDRKSSIDARAHDWGRAVGVKISVANTSSDPVVLEPRAGAFGRKMIDTLVISSLETTFIELNVANNDHSTPTLNPWTSESAKG